MHYIIEHSQYETYGYKWHAFPYLIGLILTVTKVDHYPYLILFSD